MAMISLLSDTRKAMSVVSRQSNRSSCIGVPRTDKRKSRTSYNVGYKYSSKWAVTEWSKGQ